MMRYGALICFPLLWFSETGLTPSCLSKAVQAGTEVSGDGEEGDAALSPSESLLYRDGQR